MCLSAVHISTYLSVWLLYILLFSQKVVDENFFFDSLKRTLQNFKGKKNNRSISETFGNTIFYV